MQLLIKIAISLGIILAATAVAKKLPATAGLIGVMPLTGALVFVWVYLESHGDPGTMLDFTRGALWGLVPTILFFSSALFCVRKEFSLPAILAISFGAWIAGAFVHQWMLK
jgi:hypothetical protein